MAVKKSIIWKLAFRNVIRRKLQTILLGTMITLTTLLVFMMVGMETGMYRLLEDTYTRLFEGDIQIKNVKYEEADDIEEYLDVSKLDDIIAVLNTYNKSEVFYTRRSKTFGLADANNKNYAFQLVGVDYKSEKDISMIPSSIIEGEFIGDGDYNNIVIGYELAEFLSLKVGDEVVLMSGDVYESFVIDAFKVKGIFKVGEQGLDKGHAFISNKYFADNIMYGDDFSHNLAIRIKDSSYRADLLNELKKVAPKNVAVLNWDEVVPQIKQSMEFQFAMSALIYVVFISLISFTLLNSIMLATVKRMSEFGILNAIGYDNKDFKWLLFYENLILSGSAILMGSLIGGYLTYYFGEIGITFPEDFADQKDAPFAMISSTMYPNIANPIVLFGPILIFISSTLAIIPPIIKLQKSNPVKSLTS